jgi:hypothetical protein
MAHRVPTATLRVPSLLENDVRMLMLSAMIMMGLASSADADDLSALSDEFEARAELGGWTVFHEAFGWPNKIRHLDIGATTPGALNLQPYDSAWVRDLNAPFLYHTIRGDFDVRARVRVRGAESAIPGGTWSLGGLFARVPNGLSAGTWQPRLENWHFITTGVGHARGETMTETKGTYNSYSSLKLRPFASGWIELRLVRVGVSLVAMARADGGSTWQVRDRWYRMEGNPSMQVGLVAYASSDEVNHAGREDPPLTNTTVNTTARTDMMLEVDWIRFSRPAISAVPDWYAQVSANPLADPGVTDEKVLALLGN